MTRQQANEFAIENGLSTIEELERKLTTNENGLVKASEFFEPSIFAKLCNALKEEQL